MDERKLLEWTDEELKRVGELRESKKRWSWREIALEMNRDVVDVRTTWRRRVKPAHGATPDPVENDGNSDGIVWDENKVLSLVSVVLMGRFDDWESCRMSMIVSSGVLLGRLWE